MRSKMAATLKCKDVGMDCDFIARGETEEGVLKLAAEYAAPAHGMTEMSDDVIARVRAGIKTNNFYLTNEKERRRQCLKPH